MPQAISDGQYFRFTGTVPDASDDVSIVDADITLSVNGDLLFSSASKPNSVIIGQGQASIPLPQDAAGTKAELTYAPHNYENIIFPPMVRLESFAADTAANIAYANFYGIPACVYGLVFVAVTGLFILTAAIKKPNIPLIIPVLAAGALTVHNLSAGAGYYFLPQRIAEVFSDRWISLIIPLLMIAYIIINTKRGALKLFLMLTVLSAAVLSVFYVISLSAGSYLSFYINESIISFIRYGYYDDLLHWVTIYLVLAAFAAALYISNFKKNLKQFHH